MSSDPSNNQEIQFRKRARRRLVGAIALVLLMITILPMILDDRSAKTPPQEIAISIPSQDSGEFSSKVVPVDTESAVEQSATDTASDPEASASAAQDKPVQNKPVEPSSSVSDQNQPAVSEPKKAAEVKAPPQHSEKAAAAKPVSVPPAAVKPAAVQEAKKPAIEKKPAEAVADKGNGFLVQIGVFSDPANVRQLQDKLQAKGLKSHTEKLTTAQGEKTRLRVGPYVTRADAESALSSVKDAGLSGMVISNK